MSYDIHITNKPPYNVSLEKIVANGHDSLEVTSGSTYRAYEIKRLRREEAINRFELGVIFNKRTDELSRRAHLKIMGIDSYALRQSEKMAEHFNNNLYSFVKYYDECGNTWSTIYKNLITKPKKPPKGWQTRLENLNGIVKSIMNNGSPEEKQKLIESTGELKGFLDRHFASGIDHGKLGLRYHGCACCGDIGQSEYSIREYNQDGSVFQYPICNNCIKADNEPRLELLMKAYWNEYNVMHTYLEEMNG